MTQTYVKDQFISDFKFQQEIKTLLVVKYIAIQEARDGRLYLNVILSDKSGDIESRSWKNAEEIFSKIKKGDFVRVEGKVNVYQNNKQLIISSIDKISDEIRKTLKESDFLLASSIPAEKMFQDLTEIVENLDEVYIKDLLLLILNENDIKKRLLTWPAAKTIHHAYKSGLLEHILSCVNLSVSLGSHYNVNTSYVVAGAILHDLAKIYEMTAGQVVEYTDEGRLIGHLVNGVELIEKYAYRVPNFPKLVKLHLKHIIISHHGEYEYGSPKLPQTSEAMLLHLIDMMDSRMSSFGMSKKLDQRDNYWTGYVKHLDRPIYRQPLPSFKEYRNLPDSKKSFKKAPNKKAPYEKDIKQNLGKLLEGIEVTEKN
jgi:3'-5' exoribonuclease